MVVSIRTLITLNVIQRTRICWICNKEIKIYGEHAVYSVYLKTSWKTIMAITFEQP